MTARALHSDAYSFAYENFESGEPSLQTQIVLGERICQPNPRRSGSSVLGASIVIAVLLLIGCVYLKNLATFEAWWSVAANIASSAMDSGAKLPAGPPVDANAKASPPSLPLKATEVADAPGATAGVAAPASAAPVATEAASAGNAKEEETKADEAPSTPLPPPTFDKSDPLKAKAVAAGLHPDLSQSLLKRLTVADYRNAKHAIQTALTETPDAEVFTWPRDAKPQMALFEIHFVRGAVSCRRYVVVVSKDRWSTTAPAMEKCGVSAPTRHAKAGLTTVE